MHALIVDDSLTMRTLLSWALASLGFDVDGVGDAPAAVRRLDRGAAPDLVVVDHNLPGADGLQFVVALRARPGGAAAKVLMVSAEGRTAFVERALACGVDEYLFKPFTADDVTSKVALLGLLRYP